LPLPGIKVLDENLPRVNAGNEKREEGRTAHGRELGWKVGRLSVSVSGVL
jgi:hypothetical protein